jgi:peptide/nickel transport system permease protein
MRRIARHAVRMFLVMLLAGFVGATLVRLAPGFGVDEEELDVRFSHQSNQAIRGSHSNRDSLPLFYLRYLQRTFRGDLGISNTLHQPVSHLLAERAPETIRSVGIGLVVAWTLGLSLAIPSVMSRNWGIDLFASLMAAALLCVPAGVLAILSVIARMPGQFVIGLIVFPKVFRFVRNLFAHSESLPHVVMARAKGLGAVRILIWHILPITAPQMLALFGVSVSMAFAAAIPVEALCDLPGIGQLAWKAALGRDVELLVILTLIVTAITLLANSGSDLLEDSHRTGAA